MDAPTYVLGVVVTMTSCVAVNQQPAATNLQPGEVEFELAAGGAALVVPVSINDQGPFPFVLDTGATVTCVDQALADELKLRDTVGYGGGIRGMSAMRVVSIDSVGVGTAKAEGVNGCVVDLQPMQKAGLEIQGLLGLNFLKAYRVTIDFEKRRVSFEPAQATR
jgi:predicted aspartyl protease